MRFEGKYLNGKRQGKGKEYYYHGKLEFEGEYLNGERNEKGKEYFNSGNLMFKGEYKNGKKWSGKGYNRYDNFIFKLKNGKGYVLEYLNDELISEGEYINLMEKKMEKDMNIMNILIMIITSSNLKVDI